MCYFFFVIFLAFLFVWAVVRVVENIENKNCPRKKIKVDFIIGPIVQKEKGED